MFNSGYKGIRAVDGSGIVTLKDVEVQQTSLQPKITSWSYTNGSYVPYPDTAIVGGETIVIYGSGFQNGANVYIGSTAITSTRLDQNRITFTAPSQSAGSYVLYVINPNGNAAVYAPGIYYNSYPVWNTTTYANTFIAPTSSVSFNLNATDSANLTFTLQSGSLPTGLTLYPSGLISGTTTVANTTVYTFTAVATDSFNQAAQASIIYTITYIISDPYFNQTTLLLNGETNTNTYIQDISTNNFAITPVGAATPNRFNPLWGNGYYGNYFDGSTGGIDTPVNQTALQLGSNNFTIEAWINLSTTPSNFIIIFGCESLTYDGILFGISTSNTIQINISSNGSTYNLFNSSTFATVIKTNTWTHVALVRNNGTLYAYINGVQDSTTYNISTNSIYFNSASVGAIGIRPPTQSLYFPGYISNLRVVNGTAVYTSNFTPSTTPLTAIANTALLTCQSANFVDNSTNAFTLTPTGTVKVVSNQPFGALPSSVQNYGSSLFDGSTGYLTMPSSNLLGSGNWTMEAWVYFTNTSSSYDGVICTGPTGTIQGYISKGDAGLIDGVSFSNQITYSTTYFQWLHYALVCNGATLFMYINGVLVGSVAKTGNPVGTTPIIGRRYSDLSSYQMNGYISNARVVKGTAVYTSSFTPPTTPLTAIANTALLTLQNKNGANNNTFYDDSVNNFAITRTGTPTQGTFTPFSQTGWSNYFDGSTGYFYMGTASNWSFLNNGTTNYTIECWVYPTSTSNEIILGTDSTVYGAGMYVGINGANAGDVALGINNSNPGGLDWVTNTGGWVPQNTWTHIAVCIAVNTLASQSIVTIYTNGVSRPLTLSTIGGSYDGWPSVPSNSLLVGACQGVSGHAPSASYLYVGYISNLRITKSIVYASAFTPPTAPLTAIANTALLTCQSNRFIDNSTNAYAITPSGTVQVQAFSPFAPGVSYSSANNGGSMYFNGSTDYLNAVGTSTVIGTGDFTIEFWAYINAAVSNAAVFVDMRASSSAVAPLIQMYTSNILYYSVGSSNVITGPALAFNQWYHIVVSRASGSTKMFVNGVQVGSTYTDSNTYVAQTNRPILGSYGDTVANRFNGYLSNLRILNQSLYTTTFTPPTAPPTPTANASLLLLGTNTGVQDATGKNDIITVGSAKTQANTVKYGTGAMYFDGAGNYLTLLATPLVSAFGSGSFTVEAWIYPTQSGTFTLASSNYNYSSGVGNWSFYFYPGSASLLYFNTTSVNHASSTTTTISLNTWTHIAYSRNGSTAYFFVNGTQVGTTVSDTTNYPSGGLLYIGQQNDGTGSATGYIDDLRITNGVARYTANFTPPTVPDLTQ